MALVGEADDAPAVVAALIDAARWLLAAAIDYV